jgi:hypothetical protein
MNTGSGKASLLCRIWGARGARLLVGDALVICLLAAGSGRVAPRAVGRALRLRTGRRLRDGGRDLTSPATRHEVLGPIGVTRVEVRGGRVRVLSSPCPQQICRHGGWIGAPGSLLVCLPNEVVVRVPGEPGDGPAAVSR